MSDKVIFTFKYAVTEKHMSRLAEDIINYFDHEYGDATISDSGLNIDEIKIRIMGDAVLHKSIEKHLNNVIEDLLPDILYEIDNLGTVFDEISETCENYIEDQIDLKQKEKMKDEQLKLEEYSQERIREAILFLDEFGYKITKK